MSNDFFKGYIKTKNKTSIMAFKDKPSTELLTYDDVKDLPEFAGVLNDTTVLVDFDDSENANIALKIVKDLNLKCRVVETTKGYHLFFKNNGFVDKCATKIKLACGLVADIKVGSTNCYAVCKFDNKMREIVYDKDRFDSGDYQELPKFLSPVRTNVDFLNLKEGDGRNSSFYGYILTLQKYGFSNQEIDYCIRLTNKYVLKEPLSENELNVILREEAFSKPNFYNDKNKFLFDEFAIYLKNNSNIIRLNDSLHIYRDGIYVDNKSAIEHEMIKLIPKLKKADRTEVFEYINVVAEKNSQPSSVNYIAFENGVYDIETGEMLKFSPDLILINKIKHNYNPNAYSEIVDKTLNKLACNDPEIRSLLEECIGYCFYRTNELGKAFVLTGLKSNGKSTFLDMIKNVLSTDNVSALDIQDFKNEYNVAELYGKLANIGDDISDNYISDSAVFKKLVTGDRLTARKIYGSPFAFNNYAKILLSANDIPKIKDRTGAVQRRLVIIPFNATFSKSDPDYDPHIKYKLQSEECMEYLIKIGIDGLKRVLENKSFSSSNKVEKELKEYEEINNPIVGFFNEKDDLKIVDEPTKYIYAKYTEYCYANNHQPMNQGEFSKQVKRLKDVEITRRRVNGELVRIFVEKE